MNLTPTCTKTGTSVRSCSGCGKDETKALPKSDHTYGKPYKDSAKKGV